MTKNSWPIGRVAELERLVDGAKSPAEIAATMGITKNSVVGKAARMGYQFKTETRVPRQRSSRRATVMRVDDLLRDGGTVHGVATSLGLAMDYVKYRNDLLRAERQPLGHECALGYCEEKDEAFVDLLCARGGLPRIVGSPPNIALADPWGKVWRGVRT